MVRSPLRECQLPVGTDHIGWFTDGPNGRAESGSTDRSPAGETNFPSCLSTVADSGKTRAWP